MSIHDLQIFLPFCELSSLFCWYLLEHKNFKNLRKFNLSIFSFVAHSFEVISKKILLTEGHKGFLFMFSSKNFIILAFNFRSRIHFGLIFIYGIRQVFIFIFMQIFRYSASFIEIAYAFKLYTINLLCQLFVSEYSRKQSNSERLQITVFSSADLYTLFVSSCF